MKSTINKLFGWLFPKKRIAPQPASAAINQRTETILSEEDWSGDDYIFDKPKSGRRTIIRTKGKVHNLKKIFNRLNEQHFDGKIKAKITWGRYGCRNVQRRRSITLGTYSSAELLIRIHPALDSKEVPEYFVEHVIHHEILHEVHPPIQGSGYKRIVHHYDFRKAETATPSYKEAIVWQRANTRRIFYTPPRPRKNELPIEMLVRCHYVRYNAIEQFQPS
jgi:hypothetical protein